MDFGPILRFWPRLKYGRIYFIFYPSGMYALDSNNLPCYHKYEVYGPQDHQLMSWDAWSMYCFRKGGQMVSRECIDFCLLFFSNGMFWEGPIAVYKHYQAKKSKIFFVTGTIGISERVGLLDKVYQRRGRLDHNEQVRDRLVWRIRQRSLAVGWKNAGGHPGPL